jgi:hypothetical protein
MSVHFNNTCTKVDDVICSVPCETKWSKTQPNLRMQGWASRVIINNNTAFIE